MESNVVLIGYTPEPDRIASSGARISTTAGDSLTIFRNADDPEKNGRLVRKVLASGHRTVIEHICFNLAFVNVSAYAEQFMLEFRLTSFTVKSRRYVDFRSMGTVTPAFVDGTGQPLPDAEGLRRAYEAHMGYLFDTYARLLEAGVPKEDARFLLPYGYCSNFYCTVNARELLHIMDEMSSGRGSGNAELRALGQSLREQVAALCPYLLDEEAAPAARPEKRKLLEAIPGLTALGEPGEGQGVALLGYTPRPEEAVARAALIGATGYSAASIEAILADPARQEQILEAVFACPRPRELEQVAFTFRINGVSLAVLTHLTRHRIQSLIVPAFYDGCRPERYLIPPTVAADPALLALYREAFARTQALFTRFAAQGLRKEELCYLFLSGNLIDVTTTMNGRELYHFISLRSCNRTQWETRIIAIRMLNLLRQVSPRLFRHYGPSCFTQGHCPEGKLSCGKSAETQRRFQEAQVELPQ